MIWFGMKEKRYSRFVLVHVASPSSTSCFKGLRKGLFFSFKEIYKPKKMAANHSDFCESPKLTLGMQAVLAEDSTGLQFLMNPQCTNTWQAEKDIAQ